MTLRDPYRTKISQDSLKGTYLKHRKRQQAIDAFDDTELVGPRYDAVPIQEEQPGQQEMVQIDIDDDFAKDIESDEYD